MPPRRRQQAAPEQRQQQQVEQPAFPSAGGSPLPPPPLPAPLLASVLNGDDAKDDAKVIAQLSTTHKVLIAQSAHAHGTRKPAASAPSSKTQKGAKKGAANANSFVKVAKDLQTHALVRAAAAASEGATAALEKQIFSEAACERMYRALMRSAELDLNDEATPTAGHAPHAPELLKLARKHYFERVVEVREAMAEREATFRRLFAEIQELKAGVWDDRLLSLPPGAPVLDPSSGPEGSSAAENVKPSLATVQASPGATASTSSAAAKPSSKASNRRASAGEGSTAANKRKRRRSSAATAKGKAEMDVDVREVDEQGEQPVANGDGGDVAAVKSEAAAGGAEESEDVDIVNDSTDAAMGVDDAGGGESKGEDASATAAAGTGTAEQESAAAAVA